MQYPHGSLVSTRDPGSQIRSEHRLWTARWPPRSVRTQVTSSSLPTVTHPAWCTVCGSHGSRRSWKEALPGPGKSTDADAAIHPMTRDDIVSCSGPQTHVCHPSTLHRSFFCGTTRPNEGSRLADSRRGVTASHLRGSPKLRSIAEKNLTYGLDIRVPAKTKKSEHDGSVHIQL